MLVDNLFDRFTHRLRHSRRERLDEPLLDSNRRRAGSRNTKAGQHGAGFFNNADHIVINGSTFIEHRNNFVQNFVAGTAEHYPVLERIAQYANLDAAADSNARFPPPTCHPGTRSQIGDKLFNWLGDSHREWNLMWLTGSAGTGKSAVAQTLAERCAEVGRLGGSFFFSRPNDRDDPNTVIPTLVYQLATCLPPYKSLVTAQIANDPELLRKTRRTQFKKLIVEPLSLLQIQRHPSAREPLLIVLDGLDECKGEDAQREIVEMIGEVTQLRKDLPLVWLVCSRPEPHLKYLFSRADFTIHCGHEELAIDAESIADVDFYLRDGLEGIKVHFPDVTIPTWPPEAQVIQLSEYAAGHFGFASTSLRYIGDLTHAAPMRRLGALLSFLEGVGCGGPNPLKALDALYTAIFDDIPEDILIKTMQILGPYIFTSSGTSWSAQSLCNFLHVDQATFYSALRKLHSVVDVPSPETALQRPLHFYHASFQDFLRDPARSSKFAINRENVYLNDAKLYLSWYKTDLELFHTTDGPIHNESHDHGILPGLEWVSDENRAEISREIAMKAESWCWDACYAPSEWDEAFLFQVQDFSFRYVRPKDFFVGWRSFLNRLWNRGSLSRFIRTKPRTEVDLRLLKNMEDLVGSLWSSTPAIFPLEWETVSRRGEYFFLGHGPKTIICWVTGYKQPRYSVLNSDDPLSEEWIDAYRAWFEEGE